MKPAGCKIIDLQRLSAAELILHTRYTLASKYGLVDSNINEHVSQYILSACAFWSYGGKTFRVKKNRIDFKTCILHYSNDRSAAGPALRNSAYISSAEGAVHAWS